MKQHSIYRQDFRLLDWKKILGQITQKEQRTQELAQTGFDHFEEGTDRCETMGDFAESNLCCGTGGEGSTRAHHH